MLLLLLLVGIPFLLQPMNWWARYTLWIYALGLPCFAALVGMLTERHSWYGWLARLWLDVAMTIALVEGWNCCYFVCTGQPMIDTIQTQKLWHDRRHQPLHESLWPTLNTPFFAELFASDAGVAMTDITTQHGNNVSLLQGGLSARPGQHRIVHLDHPPAGSEIDQLMVQGIQYVICDDGLTIPESLKQRVVHTETAGGVWAGRLPSTVP